MKKIWKYILKPKKIILALASRNIIKLSDKKYLELKYKLMLNKKLNLDNPQTYNEKIQWLKLYDRKEEYIEMVDKYAVKKFIMERIGEQYIIPSIGVYEKFDSIDFSKLPNQFVIKCTHDSGGVIICKDKSTFNVNRARKFINKKLKKNYFYTGREWPYKNIKPRIIIEEYMEDKTCGELRDYKFMCFSGKVECSFVCSERFSQEGLKVTFFDREWKVMPFKRHYPKSDKKIPKPKNYEKMVELAELLSRNIPFVRVDFYEHDDKIYFGELTFYPGGGMEEFEPEIWDKKLGDLIKIQK